MADYLTVKGESPAVVLYWATLADGNLTEAQRLLLACLQTEDQLGQKARKTIRENNVQVYTEENFKALEIAGYLKYYGFYNNDFQGEWTPKLTGGVVPRG